MHIKREIENHIQQNLFKGKVIIIYGARRVGKTTLVKQVLKEYPESKYINCELLQYKTALETTNSEKLKDIIGNNKLMVLDEAQNIRDIGLILKIIVDTFPGTQIIATGSSRFDLASKISEALTGRMRKYTLYPFSVNEVSGEHSFTELIAQMDRYLRFGLYPEVYDKSEEDSIEELNELASNYLYKDVLQYQNIKKPNLIIDLLRALALQLGSEVSIHEVAKLLKQNSHTVLRYIELLEKSFVIFRLRAFSRNMRNEISKTQKIYFFDLGMRNSLIQNFNPLALRNDTGGLWENFCILERMKHLENNRKFVNSYFWRTYNQQEIDYIEEYGGMLHTFEFKYSSTKKTAIPPAFSNSYPEHSFTLITPDNFHQLFN
jgi:predicted AAA+ superfamily ATPase